MLKKISSSTYYCRKRDNGEYTSIYNAPSLCEMAGIKIEDQTKIFISIHENQDRDCKDDLQYWGWLDLETKYTSVSMIYTALFLLDMCSPDAFKSNENKGLGKKVRLNIISDEDLTKKVTDSITTNYSEESVTEWLDQEMVEWVEDDELEEYDGEYYDAYYAYSHGEAESAICVQITEDFMKQHGYGDDFDIHIKINEVIIEVYDILDH